MTATPAHTPLPWKHQAGFQNVYALSGGDVGLTIHIAKTNEEQVAGGYAEAEANAAFIVRACNNHYAAKNALKAAYDELSTGSNYRALEMVESALSVMECGNV